MPIGLAVYGTTFAMGLASDSSRPTITVKQLMDQALSSGLEGVEFPSSLVAGEDLEEVAAYAADNKLYINLASSGFDAERLSNEIDLASKLGAKVVRTVVGGAKIGGDRRPLAGRWSLFMQDVLDGLKRATETAEKEGICLAVENHQDLASEELIWLSESINSSYFGITLDTGNPLATAEEPLYFYKKMAPYIKNVHLKDYHIYVSEEGYRLVRSPLGQGVINFPALFSILADHCPQVTMSIELGALEARHIRLLADDFWPEYAPRNASHLAHVIRFALDHAKRAGDWRTPFERGETEEAIIAYEERQLLSSLAYMLPLYRSVFSSKEKKQVGE